MFFSIIVPVYNRPYETKELLDSLLKQSYKFFEVIIIEDGSTITCKDIVSEYKSSISIHYVYQQNTGQGFARNNGMSLGKGDFFIMFDSDCVVPPHYLQTLNQILIERKLDAFGGPDQADKDFSSLQKAINYSMTSVFTTGGIRGKLKDPSKYQARGFNMGISKEVFYATGGFIDPNQAEDIELSIRLKKMGFKLELIKEAFVYHKRRNTLYSFLKQSYSFGKNRIHVSRFHPDAIKSVHLLPLAFLSGIVALPILYLLLPNLFYLANILLLIWSIAVVVGSSIENKSVYIGLLSLPVAIGQLFSYGLGLASEGIKKLIYG